MAVIDFTPDQQIYRFHQRTNASLQVFRPSSHAASSLPVMRGIALPRRLL